MEWVKVTKQLPKVGINVLLFNPVVGITVGKLMNVDGIRWITANEKVCDYAFFSHWQELPGYPTGDYSLE